MACSPEVNQGLPLSLNSCTDACIRAQLKHFSTLSKTHVARVLLLQTKWPLSNEEILHNGNDIGRKVDETNAVGTIERHGAVVCVDELGDVVL